MTTNKERVEQLIVLSDKLRDILAKEVDILTQRRPKELAEFEAEKTQLSKAYATEMARLRKSSNMTEGVPKELLKALKTTTKALRDTLNTEADLLAGLRTVSEKMVHAIAQEVARTRAPETGYGSNATYAPNAARATAFAINRTA